MNGSLALVRLSERSLHVSVLALAVGLLPLGVVAADLAPDRATDAGLTDAKPGATSGARLLDVLAGLVASDIMDWDTAFQLYAASEQPRMNELVAAGRITREASERKLMTMMRYSVAEAEIRQAVEAGKITKADARAKLVGVKKHMAGVNDARGARKKLERLAAEVRRAVAAGKLTEEEAREKLAYLREAIASKGKGDRDRDDIRDRIYGAMVERGIPRENVERVAAALPRISAELKTEGEAFELDPGMHKWLAEQGLDDGQIEFMIGLARRLNMRGDGDGAHRKHKIDWDGIKRRIEGAVERGEMTREVADGMYEGIKRRMEAGGR